MKRESPILPDDAARDAEDRLRSSYDELPYVAEAQVFTHPDHLATLATLHGLQPAPPDDCRVLEVGCADGANLLPMAYALPDSRFLGIDLSPRQIDDGRRRVDALGLSNLELEAASLLDFEESRGLFDYIIVHGVFSWVPPPVQEGILALCQRHLAPRGVAYVSYNTYPGWHGRGMVREIMRYATRGLADPRDRVEKAVEWMERLAATAGTGQDSHSVFLRETCQHLAQFRDQPSYLFHEYLEEHNTATYFHDFVDRAARHGLRYLGEADPTEKPQASPVARTLDELTEDSVETEQYFDFMTHRAFRRTLLCHQEAEGSTAEIGRLYAATQVDPVEPRPDVASDAKVAFRTSANRTFSTGHSLAKATLVSLSEIWPRAMAFGELQRAVEGRLGGPADTAVLADFLESSFHAGVVDLLARAPRVVHAVSERPRAWGLARWQARQGLPIVNPRHQTVRVDDGIRTLLARLDGDRDLRDLEATLGESVEHDLVKIAACGLLEA